MITIFFIDSNFAQTTYYSSASGDCNVVVWSTIATVTVVMATITCNNSSKGAVHRFVYNKTHYIDPVLSMKSIKLYILGILSIF